jgi:hypothetical protein
VADKGKQEELPAEDFGTQLDPGNFSSIPNGAEVGYEVTG